MYKRKILIVVIMISVLLNGCSLWQQNGEENMNEDIIEERVTDEATNNEDGNEIKDNLATKEFLIETFDITEEEIRKYEVEKVISLYQLTEEFFLEEKENFTKTTDIIGVFSRLQKDMNSEKEEMYDFSYVVEAKEYSGDYPDLSTIVRLVAVDYIGTGGSSCVIDFEKNKAYYSYKTNSVFKDIRRAEKSYDLTAKQKDEIIQALKDANMDDWDYKYENKEETSGEVAWEFGLEFKDGTIISNIGMGDIPDTYPELREVLFGIQQNE